MFREAAKLTRPIIRVVDITCVILLAGIYVFTYYDYLTTMTENGGISISAAHTEYSQAELGVIPIQK